MPILCPAGRFSGASENSALSDCSDATPGTYIPVSGAVVSSTYICNASFYCPGGTVSPTLLCPLGTYCGGGDPSPNACPPGKYQNSTGEIACKPCPEGHYCELGAINPLDLQISKTSLVCSVK